MSAPQARPIKILFLAANPAGTSHLRLDKESREIDRALWTAEFRTRFKIEQHFAVSVDDLQELLLRHQPDIVHFSGHGSSEGEIVLEPSHGSGSPQEGNRELKVGRAREPSQPGYASARAVSNTLAILENNVRCVVLNACYSEVQAQAIAEHIDCVVGMSKAVGDRAAIAFAAGFYQGLGFGLNVKAAFELGCNRIDLENLDEQDSPKLLALRMNPADILLLHDEMPEALHFELAEPQVPDYFEDRELELEKLLNLINAQKWCGIFGLGGIGKTTLAANAAKHYRNTKKNRTIWIDFSTDLNKEQALELIAQACGHSVRRETSFPAMSARLRAITRNKGFLFVLNDINETWLLEDLLQSIGDGNAVIVTGRDQGLSAVRRLVPIPLNPLPTDAAVKVLQKLTGPSLTLSPDSDLWQRISKAVGNLPLALEVIAGDLAFRSQRALEEYLEAVVTSGKWLSSEGASERLVRVLGESIQRLSIGHQRSFACLGVFAGNGFDVEAITTVCSFTSEQEADAFLLLLMRKRLINRNADDTYSLHPVVRQYAEKLLIDKEFMLGGNDPLMFRYLNHYYGLLKNFGGYEWNLEQYANLIPFEGEVLHAVDTACNLWITSKHASDKDYRRRSIDMVFLISWYLFWRGYWDLRIKLCQTVIEQLERTGERLDMGDRVCVGNLYVDRGWIHLYRGEYAESENCAVKASKLLSRSRDYIFATELNAQTYLQTGAVKEAYELFLKLRENQTENTRIWFVFSYRLSDALVSLKRFEEAEDLLSNLLMMVPRALLFKNESVIDVHAQIAMRLAQRYLFLNDYVLAREQFEASVNLFRESGFVGTETVQAQLGLAETLQRLNAGHDRVRELLQDSLRQARTLGELRLLKEVERTVLEIGI